MGSSLTRESCECKRTIGPQIQCGNYTDTDMNVRSVHAPTHSFTKPSAFHFLYNRPKFSDGRPHTLDFFKPRVIGPRFASLQCGSQHMLLLLLNMHELSVSVTRSKERCRVFNLWMTRLNHLLCL